MSVLNKNLYGMWRMIAMRFKKDDGAWESETVYGGFSSFTSGGYISTFTRAEIPFGYSGKFTIKGDDLVIVPEVCSIQELEGQTIVRTVKKLTAETLTLAMTDHATGRNYEIDFKLLTHQFE